MSTYEFREFNYSDSIITIPRNTIFYRGISDVKKPDILRPNIPIYLSSKEVAYKRYAKKMENLYHLSNKHPLKLLDLRKIINLLPILIDSYKYDSDDRDYLDAIAILSITLGIVDINIQFKLLSDFYRNNNILDPGLLQGYNRVKDFVDGVNNFKFPRGPYNKLGVRIAITDIDGYMVVILKELFKNICDGFIAPELLSPLQNNSKTHEEIVIFNPEYLEKVNNIDDIKSLDINVLISQNNILLNFNYQNKIDYSMYFAKGGNKKRNKYYDKNLFFEDDIKVEKAIKLAKSFSNKFARNTLYVKKDYYYEQFAKENGISIKDNLPVFKLNLKKLKF